MIEKLTSLNEAVIEAVAEHLGVYIEELSGAQIESNGAPLICFSTAESADEIRGHWREAIRDLSHLSREDRKDVLRHHAKIAPWIVSGVEVRLYREVQAMKGQQRQDAVVVDLGDERLIIVRQSF